jgi:uncharacterized protein YeaO (DUF488 family)
MKLAVKRVYEPHGKADGMRVLVDRLWPRGLTKQAAAIDLWAKEVAPSTELRRWFHTDPAGRWDEFRNRYETELKKNGDAVEALRAQIAGKPATLLYGTADEQHNHAALLRDFLDCS